MVAASSTGGSPGRDVDAGDPASTGASPERGPSEESETTGATSPGTTGESDTSLESSTGSTGGPVSDAVRCDRFVVEGDPTTPDGATFTYASTDAAVQYALEGVLFVPPGSGPFPAALVSHGSGGLPTSYSATIAREMVTWGLVVIAPRYTHANDNDGRNVQLLPAGNDGASEANVARAQKTLATLSCLAIVDDTRIALHGHSMGAFLNGQLAGTVSTPFGAASHTAGGTSQGPNATKAQAAALITTPYQVHHGDADMVVNITQDRALVEVFESNGVEHEFHVYPGYSHEDIAYDPTMLQRTREWYTRHGVLES